MLTGGFGFFDTCDGDGGTDTVEGGSAIANGCKTILEVP